MPRLLRLAAIALAVVASTGVLTTTTASRREEIEAAIRQRVDAGKNVGIVVATIDADGTSLVAGYGQPGPGALPLDGDSVFEIGSITKVFTAALLADMADRGEVALDDPVEQYLPAGVKVPQRNGRRITLVDLATHTSGLPRLPSNMAPRDPTNPYVDYTADRLYAFLASHELTRDVGSLHEYSNLGAGLLGHALARRAGTSYEALVTGRILRPLGMSQTGITLTPGMKEHLVLGHNTDGRVVPNWDVGVLAGAGALRSTARDLLKFARANLAAPTDRLPRLLQKMREIRAKTTRPNLSMALGWLVRHADQRTIVWHNGGTGGYRTWMGFDPDRKTAAIVLTNSQHGADDLGYTLLE
jgi:CubicO group peptidase (beta-lactamase class C family)